MAEGLGFVLVLSLTLRIAGIEAPFCKGLLKALEILTFSLLFAVVFVS